MQMCGNWGQARLKGGLGRNVGKGYRSVSGVARQTNRRVGPATAMQQGLLLESTLAGRPWANLEQIVVEGTLPKFTAEPMRSAWLALAARHDALRMRLVPYGKGGVAQEVLSEPDFEIAEQDLSDLVPEGQMAALQAFLAQDRLAGVNVQTRPGWRISLLRLSPERAVMVWTIHHALIDGISMAIVLEELGRLLGGRALPSHLGQSFARFSVGVRQTEKAAAEAFFARMFAEGADAAPLAKSGSDLPGRMGVQAASLSEGRSDALRGRVRDMGATPLNAVQAAWALVLARWTGQEQVCFGLVESGRQLMPGLEQTVGCLIATLPVRLRVQGQDSLGDVLARLRALTLEMRPHSHASLSEVRRWAGLSGDALVFDTIVMHAHGSLEARMRGCAVLGAIGLLGQCVWSRKVRRRPLWPWRMMPKCRS